MSDPTRTLSQAHRAQLHADGLTDAIIDARRYWSLSPEQIATGALDMFRTHFKTIKPGYVIPRWTFDEAIQRYDYPALTNSQIRLDEPDEHGKYLCASGDSGRFVDFWQLDTDVLFDSSPLWLVESVKAADALRGAIKGPACIIALPDCWGALVPQSDDEPPRLDPQIRQIGAGRNITLLLDADVKSNPDVHTAAGRALDLLDLLSGGRAQICLLPTKGEQKEGIGDLLAQGIKVEEATADCRTLHEFQKLPVPPSKSAGGKRRGRPRKPASDQLHTLTTTLEGDKYAHTRLSDYVLDGLDDNKKQPIVENPLRSLLRRGKTTSELRMFNGDWLEPITPEDYRAEVRMCLDQVADSIQSPELANKEEQRKASAAVASCRKYLRSRQTISAVCQLSADAADKFDDIDGAVPPNMWPAPGGKTLDLETLKWGDTDPTTALFCAGIVPKEGKTPTWDELLQTISCLTPWLGAAVEDALGWAMQGDRSDQALTFLAGKSRAGKGVILRTAARIFGSFAHQAALGTFFADGRKSDQHLQHLTRHIGRRLITAPDPSGRLNRSLALSYSGGDQVTTEQKGGRNFEFTPTGAAFLHGQTQILKLEFDDEALKARLRVLPFDISFAGREDKHLERKLTPEFPAIAWKLARRAQRYIKTGALEYDQQMRKAAQNMMKEYDPVGRWLDQCCTHQQEKWTSNKLLYQSYVRWCDREGEEIRSSRVWGRQMTTPRPGWNVIAEKRNAVRGYNGIQLNLDQNE